MACSLNKGRERERGDVRTAPVPLKPSPQFAHVNTSIVKKSWYVMDEEHREEILDENGVLSKRDNEMEATRTFKKMEMEGTELSKTYKKMAASILRELETSLGRELPEVEQFMFVHGTAECRSASILQFFKSTNVFPYYFICHNVSLSDCQSRLIPVQRAWRGRR